ncbi:MAG TPA: tryptophan synthase subunit alpha [Leucothrix mucor]|nr:tryptophan synthase subunit alpha [Leucothrix mucor]
MTRLSNCFKSLQQSNKKALIPYITAGDSNPSITVPLMHKMVEAGADIIELGVPFSDPMADGPTIQLACERALKHHTSLHDVITMTAEFRQTNKETPIVLMGYLNPVEAMGYKEFAIAASKAGVDGLLTVDLPPEEGEELVDILKTNNIDPIFLLSPTTTSERIKKVVAVGSGYLYYVSLKGVTGSSTLNIDEVKTRVTEIKAASNMPVGVGFGIKDAQSASDVSAVSDGVIVGSAIVKIIENNADDADTILNEISALLVSMREAMDS